MTDDTRRPVSAPIGILLQDTARAWRLKLDQRLRPLGLSQAKWRALVLVDRAGDGVTQRELAELLGVEGPTLVRLLDRLEADGWMERRMCERDRRSRRIHLTPQARGMLARIEAVAAELRQELLAGMADGDLAVLDRMLRDIRRRVDETE